MRRGDCSLGRASPFVDSFTFGTKKLKRVTPHTLVVLMIDATVVEDIVEDIVWVGGRIYVVVSYTGLFLQIYILQYLVIVSPVHENPGVFLYFTKEILDSSAVLLNRIFTH